MKWVLFTGTWRLTNSEVENDVRQDVHRVLERGDAVLTGGATGVDYFAMDETLKDTANASRLRVIIPAFLENYINDYRTNWCQIPVTKKDIDSLASLLHTLKRLSPASLLEMPYETITQEHYDLRHEQEVLYASEVHAFQVNGSTGTEDTLQKARKAGISISLHKKYDI